MISQEPGGITYGKDEQLQGRMRQMQEVLIFSGTSEGRRLAELLSRSGISVTVCVATEYGQEVMEQKNDHISVQVGRLDRPEMEALIGQKSWQAVVDATHPFAKEVTQNITEACRNQGREALRLLREETCREKDFRQKAEKIIYVDSAQEAIAYLNQTAGTIFFTTGSKELPEYLEGIKDISRIYVRILPNSQEVEKCHSLGLRGKQIICMQGPFSTQLNAAMMKEIQADILVTKETARAGGFPEKLGAAEQVGADVVVIRRPREKGYTLEEILGKLGVEPLEAFEKLGVEPLETLGKLSVEPLEVCTGVQKTGEAEKLSANISSREQDMLKKGQNRQIIIAGMGMGSPSNMTREVYDACQNADVIIGAGRMLETVSSLHKPVKNLYKSREIVDYIIRHPQYERIVILMSGDVGFYSGAKSLGKALEEAGICQNCQEPDREEAQRDGLGKYQVIRLCGVSSVVYFASRLQIPWEDITLMSSHGRQQNIVGMLQVHEKVFTLMDGARGIRNLSQELLDYGYGCVDMYVGCQLSYPQEEIFVGTPEQFLDFSREGALVVLLIHKKAKETAVTYGIPDESFQRGKVPMTKEEVRSISLSKLALQQDSIVYDIGAGTGSVAVECGRIALGGKVYAIEKKPEAIELIEKNKYLHQAWNVETVTGEAPGALKELPAPTHAFIGGSGGNLKEILNLLWKKSPHVRIVLNVISLETLREVMEILKEHEFAWQEIVQVTAAKAKKLGNHQLMMGQNPVYVVTLQR